MAVMKRKTWWIVGTAIVVVAGVALALALTLGRSKEAAETTATTQTTVAVKRGDITNTLVVYGSVVPKQEYTFAFAGERVKSIQVSIGERVKQNQTLVELDATQQRLSLLQAERALAEAQAGGVPADIKEKEILRQIAQENYDDATLKAPFAGVVTEINQATASSGSWSIVLIDTSELYIKADVDQLDAPAVAAGQPATAVIEPLPGRTWPVEIVEVGGMAQSSGNSTLVEVTAKLPEADPSILVGYTVQMEITIASAHDVLIVPISCLTETPKGWTAMKLADGKAAVQAVTVGATSDMYAEIKSGLKEGDLVITTAAARGSTKTTQQSAGSQSQRAVYGMPIGGFDGPGMP
jgi:multidrug efflux pump subunit AcrA (membrane-fusion protein)